MAVALCGASSKALLAEQSCKFYVESNSGTTQVAPPDDTVGSFGPGFMVLRAFEHTVCVEVAQGNLRLPDKELFAISPLVKTSGTLKTLNRNRKSVLPKHGPFLLGPQTLQKLTTTTVCTMSIFASPSHITKAGNRMR